MFGLPKTTEFNKRIQKQKFYENISVSSAMKRIFIEQIKNVYWKNKIATSTVNLAPGETVTEVEIFEVNLSASALDEAVLRQMDREIPYHIIFLLEYEGKYQAWTAYKEVAGSGTNAFKVGTYYHTDWLSENDLPLKLEGLTMDSVYENFVRQIAGTNLRQETTDESLSESVNKMEQRKLLEKQIQTLQAKVRKEKQLNKQVQLNAELKKLKNELEEI